MKQLLTYLPYRLLFLFTLSAFYGIDVKAQANFNSNTTSGNWNNPSSWTRVSGTDADGIPDADDNVTIKADNIITVNVASAANSVTLERRGGNKTINLNANLTITGSLLIDRPRTSGTSSLVSVGANTLQVGGNITINGTNNRRGVLSVSTGKVILTGDLSSSANTNAQLNFTGAGTFNIAGNWGFSASATFTPSTGTVNFNGNAQSITTATTFNNLSINSTTSTTLNADVTVNGIFTLASGKAIANGFSWNVASSAASAIIRTNGYVTGNLKRAVATGSNTYLFPVGTTAGYTPASLLLNGVTTAGSLTVSAVDGVGANYPTALHTSKRLARNWRITNAGVAGFNSTSSATFTYLAAPSDLAGGASATAMKAYAFSGSAFYPNTTSTTANSFTYTSLNTFGEFGAGECKGTLAATFTKTMASSCNGADGTITVTASGGVGAYTYSWTSTPAGYTANTAAITNLGPRDYTIVVSDVSKCTATIPDITIWKALAPTITFSGGGSSACGNTGYVTMYAGNGIAPYTYSINGTTYQTSNAFTNLAAGTYTGYVKDARGCVSTKPNIVVNAAAPIVVTAYTRQASSCANNGSIELYRTGGTGPYTYSLNNVTYQGSNVFTNLAAGTYTGWVRDSKGCKSSLANIVVTKAATLTLTRKFSNASACGNDATITLTAAGGVAPYQYSKTGATGPFQSANTFTGVAAGSYTCWVQDAKGCKALVGVTIGTMSAMNLAATSSPSGACNSSGIVKLTVTGGAGPYTYSLDNITYQSSNTFSTVVPGTYTGWVKDYKGCKKSVAGISVGVVSALSVTESHTKTSVCVADGTIQLRASGGMQPYTYSIDNITYQSSAHFPGLAAGIYTASVKDAKGCKASVVVNITTNTIAVTSSATAASSCASNNGSIQLFVSGGVNPYQFSVDGIHFSNSNTFNGLYPGTYDGYVKDAKGCLGVLLNINVGPSGCVSRSEMKAGEKESKQTQVRVVEDASENLLVRAYPNPSQSGFSVILDNNLKDAWTITVTDILGTIVYKEVITGKNSKRFGQNLRAGVYYVQVMHGDNRKTLKLIKE
ncbi:MAG: T9SS type A sorting domain-containing protein [Bacteroidetes bacterium]|nr:T9SS type A sorting domain-containing protein [Bacteroidota bacterium]